MEMALDGWKFHVLSPAFAIHWGFQEKTQQGKIRKLQINRNRKRFNEFEKEVRAKYFAKNGKDARFGNKKKKLRPEEKATLSNSGLSNQNEKSGEEGTTRRISVTQEKIDDDEGNPKLFYEYDFEGQKFDGNLT